MPLVCPPAGGLLPGLPMATRSLVFVVAPCRSVVIRWPTYHRGEALPCPGSTHMPAQPSCRAHGGCGDSPRATGGPRQPSGRASLLVDIFRCAPPSAVAHPAPARAAWLAQHAAARLPPQPALLYLPRPPDLDQLPPSENPGPRALISVSVSLNGRQRGRSQSRATTV